MKEISATDLKQRLDGGKDIQIIDVREPNEYEVAHLENSKLIPHGEIGSRVSEIDPARANRQYDHDQGAMMKDISRREAISKMAGATAGIAVMPGENSSAKADVSLQGAATSTTNTLTARAFRGQHQPRPLSFDPAKLKGLSEELIRSHWENNYGGAVKANRSAPKDSSFTCRKDVEHQAENKPG